jgi:hypothetical protein
MLVRSLCQPALAFAFVALVVAIPAKAQDADYLARFAGDWTGGGSVQRNETEQPRKVTCRITGTPSANAVSIRGKCRAAVIFTRNIGVDVRVDSSGRYTGTYTGSKIGPASLSGARSGDTVTFTVTWPKPVMGDTTATMTIVNDGNGRLRFTVVDKLGAGGPEAKVTDLSFTKS